MYHMKTATVRDVRHKFGDVIASVEQGESVAISKRGEIIAIISPPPAPKKTPRKMPDFAGRMKRLFGNAKFAGNIVVEQRGSRDY
jgi:prevent-host-death family protein